MLACGRKVRWLNLEKSQDYCQQQTQSIKKINMMNKQTPNTEKNMMHKYEQEILISNQNMLISRNCWQVTGNGFGILNCFACLRVTLSTARTEYKQRVNIMSTLLYYIL